MVITERTIQIIESLRRPVRYGIALLLCAGGILAFVQVFHANSLLGAIGCGVVSYLFFNRCGWFMELIQYVEFYENIERFTKRLENLQPGETEEDILREAEKTLGYPLHK